MDDYNNRDGYDKENSGHVPGWSAWSLESLDAKPGMGDGGDWGAFGENATAPKTDQPWEELFDKEEDSRGMTLHGDGPSGMTPDNASDNRSNLWQVEEFTAGGQSGANLSNVLEQEMAVLRRQHEAHVRELHEEALLRERDVMERGEANGYRRGVAEERERLSATVVACEASRDRLEEGLRPWLEDLQRNVAMIAVTVARKIVEESVAADSSIVRGIVERALIGFDLEEPVKIHINPADLAIIRETDVLGAGKRVVWLEDNAVARGGVFVQGINRMVDGRVDVVLEHAYRKLVGDG